MLCSASTGYLKRHSQKMAEEDLVPSADDAMLETMQLEDVSHEGITHLYQGERVTQMDKMGVLTLAVYNEQDDVCALGEQQFLNEIQWHIDAYLLQFRKQLQEACQ